MNFTRKQTKQQTNRALAINGNCRDGVVLWLVIR